MSNRIFRIVTSRYFTLKCYILLGLILFEVNCSLFAQNVTVLPTGITPATIPGNGWGTTGNTGTDATSNYLGTADNQSLVVKTNNVERIRFDSVGRTGIGVRKPIAKLHVSLTSNSNLYPITTGTVMCLEGQKEAQLTFLAGSSYGGAINFASNVSPRSGYLNYDHPKKEMTLATNSFPRVSLDSVGNVGINNTDPLAKLDVNGDFRLTERVYTNNSNVTFDVFQRQGKSYVSFNISTPGVVTVRGFDAPNNTNANGTILYMSNLSTGSVILVHNSSVPTANDRIFTHTGADVTISGRGGATLVWDSGKWRIISIAE
ncbi:MAG: hypothetical protein ACRCVT_02140 [Leadbetterella sp.]